MMPRKILDPRNGDLKLRATSHTNLKARDHCNLRALTGHKGGDGPSSLHTRRWRPKGSKKTSWMKSLHRVLHGGLWIRFHGLQIFLVKPASKRRAWRKFRETMTFFNIFSSRTYFKTDYKAKSRTKSRTNKHHQVNLLNW